MIKNQINLLDCTLRDGGYYNNWDFSQELVESYLKTMSATKMDYVEIGFRSFQSKDFKGASWYTTDNYLESINIPKNLNLGVMVNAYELISHKDGLLKATRLMFKPAKKSKIKLVRLACHFEELGKIDENFIKFENDINLTIDELEDANKTWLRKYMDN